MNHKQTKVVLCQAAGADIKIHGRYVGTRQFSARLPLEVGGGTRVFNLRIKLDYNDPSRIQVKEDSRSPQLPSFCPERHINPDGTFCLGRPFPTVRNTNEATHWWGLVNGFLVLQHYADYLGRWQAPSWPHGAAAADAQATYERTRDELPQPLQDCVQSSNTLGLERSAECPCGSGAPYDSCHRSDIVALAALEEEVSRLERVYFESLGPTTCCGTMKGCPLNKEQA